ncbi:MAG: hypothetical protein R3F59_18375 [Myxococcota bacterium]
MKPLHLVLLLSLGAVACTGDPEVTDKQTPTGTDPTTFPTVTTPTPTDTTSVTDGAWWVRDFDFHVHDSVNSLVYVTWDQQYARPAHVEFSIDEGEWLSTPSVDRAVGPNEQLVVGVPYDTDAQWRVVIDGEDLEPFDGGTLHTGILSPAFPRGQLIPAANDPSAWQPGDRYLLTSISQDPNDWGGGWYWAYIMDRKARVVWAQRAPDQHWTLFAQVAQSGDHLLIDESTAWADFDEGRDSVVHRTWLDQEIEAVATPGLHHEFVQLPDGTLAWGSQAHGGGEALCTKAPGAAEEEVIWTVTEDWPQGQGGWGGPESNGMFYDADTDTFLYSWYTNNSIVEVDHATGTSLWWAGDASGGYDFVPASSQYAWQHGISYTDAGTLLVSSEYRPPSGGPTHTWLLEYEVDHTNHQLRLVWSNDSGARADTNGQAWRLANGNTLHVVGSAGVVREVGPDDRDVWRVEYGNHYLLGHGQFIDDLYALVKPADAP